MPVRSVRLPESLWRRLEAAQAEVNASRRPPVPLSTVIRLLLERGLDSSQPLNLESKVVRPDRVHRQRAARIAANVAAEKAEALFQRTEEVVERLGITPPKFTQELGGDRDEAYGFYVNGRLPDRDPAAFVARVEAWLAMHAA